MKQKIHLYEKHSDGEMSICGRGFYADRSFEEGTTDIKKVTCKQCLKKVESLKE